jgi:hypothetical protein
MFQRKKILTARDLAYTPSSSAGFLNHEVSSSRELADFHSFKFLYRKLCNARQICSTKGQKTAKNSAQSMKAGNLSDDTEIHILSAALLQCAHCALVPCAGNKWLKATEKL